MNNAYIFAVFKSSANAQQALNVLRTSKNRSAQLIYYSKKRVSLPKKGVKATDYYRNWLLPEETGLIIPVTWSKVSTIQKVLQEYSKLYSLFVFAEEAVSSKDSLIPFLKKEGRIRRSARKFASTIITLKNSGLKTNIPLLLKKLSRSEEVISATRYLLQTSDRQESGEGAVAEWGVAENVGEYKTQAEWILDNWHTMRGEVGSIRQSLRLISSGELQVVEEGEFKGYPRIYSVARDIIERTNGFVSRESLTEYLDSFQRVQPLYENELEILPMFLKLALLEYVAQLCGSLERTFSQQVQASFWVSRLISAKESNIGSSDFMSEIRRTTPKPEIAAVETILGRLSDEECNIPDLQNWLESVYSGNLLDTLQTWQADQANEQVLFRNVSFSLNFLAYTQWDKVLLSISGLEKTLASDPAQVYQKMDNSSKQYYRQHVQELSKGCKNNDELEIAQRLIAHASTKNDELQRHIGYFLIDEGRGEFEKSIDYRIPLGKRIVRAIKKYHSVFFISSTIFLTLLGLAGLMTFLTLYYAVTFWQLLLIVFISSWLMLDVAIQLVQYGLLAILPTDHLPKLDFEKGIPERYATTVVIPTLLLTVDSVRSECDRLEVRYLANPDPAIRFGLLTDFSDANTKTTLQDAELLEIARSCIDYLNTKYGRQIFFLFHRERTWSESEQSWIGWERKRGKLEQFNAWMLGKKSTHGSLLIGDEEAIKKSVYALTLDADAQLPPGSAHRLVGCMAHPLNRAVLSPDTKAIARGYSVIMPKTSTSLPSATATFFSRIHSNGAGVDPYTPVSADFYQDFTGYSSYQGKGIYDVRAFYSVLDGKIPESYVLSHDLLEGLFTKVGLASDIELFDLFPSDYLSFSKREHRWIRGDWQIMGWLKSHRPHQGKDPVKNELSLFDRWKILDNLRRSVLPLFSLVAILISWFILYSPVLDIVVFIVFTVPVFLRALIFIYKKQFSELKTQDFGYGILRSLSQIALIPHSAYITVDAVTRVIYRKWFSHKLLLEWQSAAETQLKSGDRQRDFILSMSWIPLSVMILWFMFGATGMSYFYSPVLLLALMSPVMVGYMNRTTSRKIRSLSRNISASDRLELRALARRTWRYFDDFMTEEYNFLPPDNYQIELKKEVADRTSPTNLGMGLLCVLSARDFGFKPASRVIEQLGKTLHSIAGLERYRGHFYNWYTVQSKETLGVKYVSMVDSGNLAGSLWSLHEGLKELQARPIIDVQSIDGIIDTCRVANEEEKGSIDIPYLKRIFSTHYGSTYEHFEHLSKLNAHLQAKKQGGYWLEKSKEVVAEWLEEYEQFLGWATILRQIPRGGLLQIDSTAHEWRIQALTAVPSLIDMAAGNVPGITRFFRTKEDRSDFTPELNNWLSDLETAFKSSRERARHVLETTKPLLDQIEALSEEMDFSFLYDQELRVFHIGYNTETHSLDQSHYDLLASEARVGSLVAIARGQVPIEHWWALKRRVSEYKGIPVTLSWSGTMFEFLMPVLFTRVFENSLLEDACKNAVEAQKAQTRLLGLPWGVSESGYSGIDRHKNYQYFAFGSPGLATRRGLRNELVISPYSTVLSLMIQPQAGIDNLQLLKKEGMLGQYGFYEAIDYRAENKESGKKGVIVYSYMAHHQGMSLLALSNTLHEGAFQRRFHERREIKACESLLFEKVPARLPITKEKAEDESLTGENIELTATTVEPEGETMPIVTPQVATYGNNAMRLAVSHRGGGYTFWNEFILNRWRPDLARDHSGQFFYVRDLDSGELWSPTLDPIRLEGVERSQKLLPDKAVFTGIFKGISVTVEIALSPDDAVQVRKVTIVNSSPKKRSLEISSFEELALATIGTEKTHPVFNSMFIETEWVSGLSTLLAWRRPRSHVDKPLFCAQSLVGEGLKSVSYETDRKQFVGRGGSITHPKGAFEPLSNSVGFVLDPIFSIRQGLTLSPGERREMAFVTSVAATRAEVVSLIECYGSISAVEGVFTASRASIALQMRLLKITEYSVHQAYQMAAAIIYKYRELRHSQFLSAGIRPRINDLWSQTISGDLPLVVIEISKSEHVDLVKQVLVVHTYLRMQGLYFDLVILTQTSHPPYLSEIQGLIDMHMLFISEDRPGSIFLRSKSVLSDVELLALQFFSDIGIKAGRGTLSSYLTFSHQYPTQKPLLKEAVEEQEYVGAAYSHVLQGQFPNGIGSFANGGKEYRMIINEHSNTPGPWINVVANQHFGFLASENGVGMTWHDNSQTNRLTTWSNDPVSDPPSDITYLRDEDTNEFWSLTPLPHGTGNYVVTHGQGYTSYGHTRQGIKHRMELCTPVSDGESPPLRLKKITISNVGKSVRSLSLFTYLELVLGQDRGDSLGSVITRWNSETQVFTATNPRRTKHEKSIMFSSCTEITQSYSGDRSAFLGEGGSTEDPRALKMGNLDNTVGAGYDPCAAFQYLITLKPGESCEMVLVLGEAEDEGHVQQLVKRFTQVSVFDRALQDTKDWWDQKLGRVTVDIPDKAAQILINHWLLYQVVSCRLWARSAFFQSGGAFGFRDQLQDVMAIMGTLPELARAQILRAASRQFEEGDVQHWWHSDSGGGIRTEMTDDLLWLPFVAYRYCTIQEDWNIFNESVPFLKGPRLSEGEEERYLTPHEFTEPYPLYEHCKRAVDLVLTRIGVHGLPLIGTGDWNDGLNRVGIEGKGESVWLAWFLISTLDRMAGIAEKLGKEDESTYYSQKATAMRETVEGTSWDGDWYLRAFFDDGTPLGSRHNKENMIDSLPQSWAVLAGGNDKKRQKQAMNSVYEHLVKKDFGAVLLFTPPYIKTSHDPGYIKGYPPGVRENGGQYTHGSLWSPQAFARLGDGDRAVELLTLMNPILKSDSPEKVRNYGVEPYVMAADVYALPGKEGYGGWTWYTGSAGWMYTIWVEDVLGLSIQGKTMRINPVIPHDWEGFTLTYRNEKATYTVSVKNPDKVQSGVVSCVHNGEDVEEIVLETTGKHVVEVILGVKK